MLQIIKNVLSRYVDRVDLYVAHNEVNVVQAFSNVQCLYLKCEQNLN